MLRKGWITFLLVVFALPAAANAHNVGHIFLPDGTCQEVGSAKEAPLVGEDRTQLDLVPSTVNPPRDEYGTSFVGFWGRTPIFPGRCPVLTGASSTSALSGASPNSAPTTGPASSRPAASAHAGPSGPRVRSGSRKDK